MAVSGLFMALAVVTRPSNIVLVIPVAIYVWWYHPSRFALFCLLGCVPAVWLVWYSATHWGSLTMLGQGQPFWAAFVGNEARGVTGLLFSPARGLLVYSPVLWIPVIYMVAMLVGIRVPVVDRCLAFSVVLLVLLMGKWENWWGGISFGYRLIIETLPFLILLAARAWERYVIGHSLRFSIGIALIVTSVYIQFLGATYAPCGGNTRINEEPQRLWHIGQNDVVLCTRYLLYDLQLLKPEAW